MNRALLTLAAAGVLLLTNLVALGGAWWNRQGTPDAELLLSERELLPPYWHPSLDDNSGLALQIDVRLAVPHDAVMPSSWQGYNSYGSEARWLDETALRALGFDLPPAEDEDRSRGWRMRRQRDAWLVLELDGDAYRQQVAAVEKWAEWVRSASDKEIADKYYGTRPGDSDIETQLRNVRERDSRLYLVDAGSDPEVLRSRYPDRQRYAIASGRIRADIQTDNKNVKTWQGWVEAIDVLSLHVSTHWRETTDALLARRYENETPPHFTARIAWGKRYEPWIVDLQPGDGAVR